ncbi:MAG: tRNA (N6-threonylcarbamoyladenosine(37)-N6)-methyltransferase TrmO [Chloroflexi bacterium]|nr:tRNA (N6-threonylcarbamoyladenosine(37)-N6)-methyltransferase TrmO [Chloroflexota bacterium]
MQPIGVIRTPFAEEDAIPIQPIFSQAVSQVEVYQEYAEGLQDIEGFSHIILLYALHRSSGYALRVKPFLDRHLRGIFATRHPHRPNPIGLSVVRLAARHGAILEVEGIDVLDGTPLLDIKPYVPEFDRKADARAGWYDNRPEDGQVMQPVGR